MATEGSRVLWDGQVAVITLPIEIDLTNADALRDDLLSVINQGATTLIADMSHTTFCDSAGVSALVRAFRRATENSTKFRIVATTPAVFRVFEITGIDHLIDVYPTVAEALGSSNGGGA